MIMTVEIAQDLPHHVDRCINDRASDDLRQAAAPRAPTML
jgi:hypothetical protein